MQGARATLKAIQLSISSEIPETCTSLAGTIRAYQGGPNWLKLLD